MVITIKNILRNETVEIIIRTKNLKKIVLNLYSRTFSIPFNLKLWNLKRSNSKDFGTDYLDIIHLGHMSYNWRFAGFRNRLGTKNLRKPEKSLKIHLKAILDRIKNLLIQKKLKLEWTKMMANRIDGRVNMKKLGKLPIGSHFFYFNLVCFFSNREAVKEDESGRIQSSVDEMLYKAIRKRTLAKKNIRLGMVC